MRIRLADITRDREAVLALGEARGEWLIIPDARRRDYEALFRKVRGLGDLVEVFAKPIARASDAIFGTDLQNCAGCDERKKTLNHILPL